MLSSPSHATPSVRALLGESDELLRGFADRATYTCSGSKAAKSSASAHYQQRSSHSSGGSYRRGGKAGMMHAFGYKRPAAPRRSEVQGLAIEMNW